MRKQVTKFYKSVFRSLLLLTTLSLLTQCQKDASDLSNASIPATQVISTAKMKDNFRKSNLDLKLVDTLNDTLHVVYTPNWSEIKVGKLNDSLDYRFVPLQAVAKSKSGEYKVKLDGHSSFLLVKNGTEFFWGKFHSIPIGETSNSSSLFLYNGQLTLSDLHTGRFFVIDYRSGKTSQDFLSKAILSKQPRSSSKTFEKNSAGNTTRGWEVVCRQVTTCQWYTVCEGAVYIYSNMAGECSYPTTVTPCDYSSGWVQSSPSYDTLCENVYFPDPPNDNGGGGGSSAPSASQITSQIANKPAALFKIPCDVLQAWMTTARHTVPQAQINKLKTLTNNVFIPGVPMPTISLNNVASVQDINDAYSLIVNMDYYPVDIAVLPIINGVRATPEQFLEYIRKNINNFVDQSYSEFYPYNAYGTDDTALWNSSNPLGAVVRVDIKGPDNGSVIVSHSSSDKWTFTTIYEPMYGQHPVSGNRDFGFFEYYPGAYTFYTRGVDRLTSWDGSFFQAATNIPFNSSNSLWQSFQWKIIRFVNSHGGLADTRAERKRRIERPDWPEIVDVVNGVKPLSHLNNDCI